MVPGAVKLPETQEDLLAALQRMPDHMRSYIAWQQRWVETARPNQLPPEHDWSECGYMAGRGFGKTRVGAEWIGRATYEDPSGFDAYVIAPTFGDIKFTCFEGESGIMSVVPPDLIVEYNKTDLLIRLRNVAGGVATLRGFSAEKPERLRGPQGCRAWCDELAAWQYDDTWDMMQMGLRLGSHPQVLWTTTPKPRELVRRLTTIEPADRDNPEPSRVIVSGATYDNSANLPKSFFKQLEQYEGTTIGRQELHGELIDPEEQGVIRRSWLRMWPCDRPLPQFEHIIMSLDTAFTEETQDSKSHDPDYTACSVWGTFRIKEEHHVLLLDCWQERLGLPDLIKRVKREMNTAYGDDEDKALIKPMFGSNKPLTSGRKPDMLIIEDKGSGISLRQSLTAHSIYAYAYNPGKADKLSRLHMVSPLFAARRVWMPESEKHARKPKSWAEPLIYQLCAYAGRGSLKHDDFVDSVSQVLRVLMDKQLVSVVKPAKSVHHDAPPSPTKKANPYAS